MIDRNEKVAQHLLNQRHLILLHGFMQKLQKSGTLCIGHISHIQLYCRQILCGVLRQGFVQHIVQAISHIDEIGIGIKFPNILLHLHLPLSFGIIDLRQLCVSGQHFIPYHISCCQFRDAVINAVFIAIILLGRIKHRGILCHVFCKHTGQKLRTPFCHFIPVGNFHAGAMLPCFGFVLKCLVQFFLQSKQRLDICIFETEMLL